MTNEVIEKWEPLSGLPKKLYLSNLSDNEQGLFLSFLGEEDSPKIVFNFSAALSYRNSDESDRLMFLNEISGQQDWSLYKVKNSLFLAWLHEQSYNIHETENIHHFLFFTPNDIVDVLSIDSPKIKLI